MATYGLNILLDRNRLKLSDFDSTAEIGTDYEACMAPYGRILNSNETDLGECGTSDFLGPRTEQFALGSLFYLINYGFEVYGDRCLTENPYEHGPKVVELLQNMEFPELGGNPLIDNIIKKCWHNEFISISDLAAQTRDLKSTDGEATTAEEANGKSCDEAPISLGEGFTSEKEFCQDLEKRGLLHLLSFGELEQIGFTFD